LDIDGGACAGCLEAAARERNAFGPELLAGVVGTNVNASAVAGADVARREQLALLESESVAACYVYTAGKHVAGDRRVGGGRFGERGVGDNGKFLQAVRHGNADAEVRDLEGDVRGDVRLIALLDVGERHALERESAVGAFFHFVGLLRNDNAAGGVRTVAGLYAVETERDAGAGRGEFQQGQRAVFGAAGIALDEAGLLQLADIGFAEGGLHVVIRVGLFHGGVGFERLRVGGGERLGGGVVDARADLVHGRFRAVKIGFVGFLREGDAVTHVGGAENAESERGNKQHHDDRCEHRAAAVVF